ncbi:hypothetical protein [Prevotella sp. KH2C16]|nr:hypothetical protein [Prevotella sp. KH2C16]SFG72233.1 hypothetical protein SAMN05216383_13313 [Prevotella sp. KH2C16]
MEQKQASTFLFETKNKNFANILLPVWMKLFTFASAREKIPDDKSTIK